MTESNESSLPPGAGTKSDDGGRGDAGRAEPYDEEPEATEPAADPMSPGADIARGGPGSTEPNEPA